jgi:integrase
MREPPGSNPRERVLSDDEIRTLWNGLPEALARSPECQRIIKLCLVTGQRVGEVAGITKSELGPEAQGLEVTRLSYQECSSAQRAVIPTCP